MAVIKAICITKGWNRLGRNILKHALESLYFFFYLLPMCFLEGGDDDRGILLDQERESVPPIGAGSD